MNVDVTCTLDNFRTRQDKFKIDNVYTHLSGVTTFVSHRQESYIANRVGGAQVIRIRTQMIFGINIEDFPLYYTENHLVVVELDRRSGEAISIKINVEK